MLAAAEEYLQQGNTNAAAQIFRTLSKKSPNGETATSGSSDGRVAAECQRYAKVAGYCDALTDPLRFPEKRVRTILVEAVLDTSLPPMALFFGYQSSRLEKGDTLPPLSTQGVSGVRKASKRLLLFVHPDKNPHPKAAEAATRLRSIQEQLEDQVNASSDADLGIASPASACSPVHRTTPSNVAANVFYAQSPKHGEAFSPSSNLGSGSGSGFGASSTAPSPSSPSAQRSPSMTSPPSFNRRTGRQAGQRQNAIASSPKARTVNVSSSSGAKTKAKAQGRELDGLLSTLRQKKRATCRLQCDLSVDGVGSPVSPEPPQSTPSFSAHNNVESDDENDSTQQPSVTLLKLSSTVRMRGLPSHGQGSEEGRRSSNSARHHQQQHQRRPPGDSDSVGGKASTFSWNSSVDSLVNAHIEAAYDDFESRRHTGSEERQHRVKALSDSLLKLSQNSATSDFVSESEGGPTGSSTTSHATAVTTATCTTTVPATTKKDSFHLPPISPPQRPLDLSHQKEPDPRFANSTSSSSGVTYQKSAEKGPLRDGEFSEKKVILNAGCEDEQTVLSVRVGSIRLRK